MPEALHAHPLARVRKHSQQCSSQVLQGISAMISRFHAGVIKRKLAHCACLPPAAHAGADRQGSFVTGSAGCIDLGLSYLRLSYTNWLLRAYSSSTIQQDQRHHQDRRDPDAGYHEAAPDGSALQRSEGLPQASRYTAEPGSARQCSTLPAEPHPAALPAGDHNLAGCSASQPQSMSEAAIKQPPSSRKEMLSLRTLLQALRESGLTDTELRSLMADHTGMTLLVGR